MGPFEVAVVAIVCGIVYKIANTYLEHKGALVAEEEINQLRQELSDMKQRLVTLERIVTDEGYDLKSKFENL
ncbi:hypothetical protein HR45_01175 [Shewanella mangrovi]|uniref:Phage shock protein B n=1 Tax=Shewanella mangrovi TaxID=1515746 RepID=A0A094LUX4_9GAMM|nr:hypothetical protein [Shewanella mangrovi]KFZ39038.1 hypothetical protein HR45_01175 [Shewanella mangrovi]